MGPSSRAARGVKFLIDAQLPARLAEFLNQAGHDAIHTVELPDENRSTDTRSRKAPTLEAMSLDSRRPTSPSWPRTFWHLATTARARGDS